MSCIKLTSTAVKLVSAMRLACAASITWLACPGAPGWTMGAASAVLPRREDRTRLTARRMK
jgi:hypothetical protein